MMNTLTKSSLFYSEQTVGGQQCKSRRRGDFCRQGCKGAKTLLNIAFHISLCIAHLCLRFGWRWAPWTGWPRKTSTSSWGRWSMRAVVQVVIPISKQKNKEKEESHHRLIWPSDLDWSQCGGATSSAPTVPWSKGALIKSTHFLTYGGGPLCLLHLVTCLFESPDAESITGDLMIQNPIKIGAPNLLIYDS